MSHCPSPLESLAAFALAFVAGALSALGLAHALRQVRQDSHAPPSPPAAPTPPAASGGAPCP